MSDVLTARRRHVIAIIVIVIIGWGSRATGAKSKTHQVILSNLEPGQSYGYTIIITDTAGNQNTYESN